MRLPRPLRSLLVAALVCGAATSGWASDPEIIVQRLCDQAAPRKVYLTRLGDEVVWSDSALMERAVDLPPMLAKFLSEKAVANPAILKVLQDLDDLKDRGSYRPSLLKRIAPGDTGCVATDGVVQAKINCVYLDYLRLRYPRLDVRVKAALDPVLFLAGKKLVAAVMPLR